MEEGNESHCSSLSAYDRLSTFKGFSETNPGALSLPSDEVRSYLYDIVIYFAFCCHRSVVTVSRGLVTVDLDHPSPLP